MLDILQELQERNDHVGILARSVSSADDLIDHLDGLLTCEPNHPHYIELLLLKTDLERRV